MGKTKITVQRINSFITDLNFSFHFRTLFNQCLSCERLLNMCLCTLGILGQALTSLYATILFISITSYAISIRTICKCTSQRKPKLPLSWQLHKKKFWKIPSCVSPHAHAHVHTHTHTERYYDCIIYSAQIRFQLCSWHILCAKSKSRVKF